MSKSNKILVGIIVILAIAVVYLSVTSSGFKLNNKKTETENNISVASNKLDPMKAQIPADLTDEQKSELKAGSDAHAPAELTFHIAGGSFYFTPNEIKVKQGDKVKIIFNNAGGTHNLILDAFNVQTKTINTGESDTIEFTADKKGTFEFYCSFGKGYHRMKGQIGVLLVE